MSLEETCADVHEFKVQADSREKKIERLERKVIQLEEHCADLESRSRRNSLRIVGLAEGSETSRPHDFAPQFLKELFGLESEPRVERAHRVGRHRGRENEDRPVARHYLICLQSFQEKEKILGMAHDKGVLHFGTSRIHIFPDLSNHYARKRASFDEVKRRLHRDFKDIKYRYNYYAGLILIPKQGEQRAFTDPKKVGQFLDNL